MRPVGSAILMLSTTLVFVVGVFASYVHALTSPEKNVALPVYDGPCSSQGNILCEMSGNSRPIIVRGKSVIEIKPVAFAKPFAEKSTQKLLPAKRHSRRDPNAWRAYQTSFKPVGPSGMPARVHHLEDPFAANKKAQELLEKAPPVFKIIAGCESRMRHYNQKTGNVLQGSVTPGDIGLLQINSLVHEEDALKYGFNIYSIYGNIGFAIKLYILKGTQPWNSSKHCWGPKIPYEWQLPLPEQL